jgi:hypothetical protein
MNQTHEKRTWQIQDVADVSLTALTRNQPAISALQQFRSTTITIYQIPDDRRHNLHLERAKMAFQRGLDFVSRKQNMPPTVDDLHKPGGGTQRR